MEIRTEYCYSVYMHMYMYISDYKLHVLYYTCIEYKMVIICKILWIVEQTAVKVNEEEKTAEENGTNDGSLKTSKIDATSYGQTSQVWMTTAKEKRKRERESEG